MRRKTSLKLNYIWSYVGDPKTLVMGSNPLTLCQHNTLTAFSWPFNSSVNIGFLILVLWLIVGVLCALWFHP